MVARLREVYQGVPVCVTGGAGFIGSHLVDALLSLGSVVSVIDDLSNSSTRFLGPHLELEPERLAFVHGSILDDAALAEAVRGARKVFHLAAVGSVPRSIRDPSRTWEVNATGTVRVLEAARAAGVGREGGVGVVYSASSSAYGVGGELPRRETMAPAPASPYAASKVAGELAVRAWATSFGLGAVSLRYFNIFGPRQPGDSAYAAVVGAFARRLLQSEPPLIYGDGRQSRDFTHVANAVLANLLAGATARRLGGEVVNIGTGRRLSVLDLAGQMTHALANGQAGMMRPAFAPARAGDVPDSQADISLARELIGYAPVVDFEEGLAETMAWYRQALAGAARESES